MASTLYGAAPDAQTGPGESLLQELDLNPMLEGCDGTRIPGERGLQMGQCFLGWLARLQKVGRSAVAQESRADVALAFDEPLPDAVGGRHAEIGARVAKGCGFIAEANHQCQEAPQASGAQAKPAEFVRAPNAERAPAAVVAALAVVAEYPTPPTGLAAVVVLGVPVE